MTTTATIPRAAAGEPLEARPWHAESTDEAIRALESRPEGLAEHEVPARLERFGPNRLPQPEARSALARFLAQFDNLLIYVLIGAAVGSGALGHWLDAVVIMGVVLVNSVIGFVQEGKAERALQAIRQMLAPRAVVLRDGRKRTVPAEELVPGDVVLLEPGEKVAADLRLIRAKGLQIQEAALTGESLPVDKQTDPVEPDAPLGDRAAMAYAGTLVTAGQGTGLVVATGEHTELGRISGMIGEVEELTTPLLRQMAQFARYLTVAILGLAVLMFGFGVVVRDFGFDEMFMAVVGLAVAAIPEGLPAILTVTLAIGVQRMAGRNAIIRRLPAVETLGSVSIICSDKTGTLTRNEMTVRAIATAGRLFEVGGIGYAPQGGFGLDGREVDVDAHPELALIMRAAVLCNDSALREADGEWRVEGDPMEGALLAAAIKAGLDPAAESREYPRADVIPFDAQHRFMATLHHTRDGEGSVYVKGAPERLLEMCERQQEGDAAAPLDPDYWRARLDEMTGSGQRVLAVAFRPTEEHHPELRPDDVEGGLTLLGLLGLIDPPREEAIAAVEECRSAGIRVKMITGDHAGTAAAIARQLHLANSRDVLTGRDLDRLGEEELEVRAPQVDVFARTSPEHKLHLVQALQARGAIVAMTGDGVNDAPALKRADVGVAMGQTGTEAAKEAAEMVLADDNFASIAHAVREGRTVYDNLKKAITLLLPVNGGESLGIIAAILLGVTLPITPLQILWVNMVSSVALAMALAFEATEAEVMARPPRRPREPLLSGFLLWRVGFVSVLFVSGIFGMFAWSQWHGATLEEARTYAVNTLVVMEIFYLFSVRYLRAPSLTFQGVLGTRPVLIAITAVTTLQLIFTYAPFMNLFFETRPVGIGHGLEILAIGVILFAILEVEKLVLRRFTGPGGAARLAHGHA